MPAMHGLPPASLPEDQPVTKEREHGPADHPKQGHATRKEAQDHLFNLVRGKGARRRSLEVYQCRWCGKYHIGHRKRRRHQQ